MNRSAWLGALSCLGVVAWTLVGARDARACGGCFTPPPPPPPPGAPPTSVDSLITGERMIFSITKEQSTLYDEITYSGSPSSFAWVLPIKGEVEVGLSADLLFGVMDQLTAVIVQPPEKNCPSFPTGCYGFGYGGGSGGGCAFGGSSSASGFGGVPAVSGFGPSYDASVDAGVSVIAQEQVGPYETVQLKSNDGSALANWLQSHGYRIPPADQKVIDHYVSEGMDFLALKLVPGEGVQSMQPVRVTTKGAFPVLPLRMVGVGTGPTTGITLWIVADGRWEPQNFPFFTMKPDELVWDWTSSSSNYEALRQQKESEFHGRGWQIESSIDVARYNVQQTLETAIGENLKGGYTTTSPPPPPPPGDAGSSGTADSGGALEGGAPEAASDTGADVETKPDARGARGEDAGAPGRENPYTLAADDIAVLYKGISGPNARVTRLRSDVSHSALSADLVIQASSDTSEVSNDYPVTHENAQPLCTVWNSSCAQLSDEMPRDKAIAFEKQVDAELAAASGSSSTGGGCACRTSSRPEPWRTTAVLLAAAAALGGLRAGQKKRKPRS